MNGSFSLSDEQGNADDGSKGRARIQPNRHKWQHTNTYELLQAINTNILDYTSPENIHKVKGRGALHDVYITNIDDSIKIANMGFTFKDAVRKPNYSLWKTNQAQR